MSQISPPIRIVLVLAVALLVAYMTVLKPGGTEAPIPSTPANTGNVANGKSAVTKAGKIAKSAKDAVTATNAQQAAEGANAGETEPAKGTAPATAKKGATTPNAAEAPALSADLKGLPAPVVKAIGANKVLAILFWNSKAAEDRAVRSTLRKIDRWDGRVFVKAAPVSKIAKYGRIARGVEVEQSPTVVVVDRNLIATPLVGFVDRQTIDQAVVDALRNSGGLYKTAYMRKVNNLCSQHDRSFFTIAQPDSPSQATTYVNHYSAQWTAFASDLRGIPAPAKFAAFKRATVADAAAVAATTKAWGKALGKNPSVGRILQVSPGYITRAEKSFTSFENRVDGKHLLSCGG